MLRITLVYMFVFITCSGHALAQELNEPSAEIAAAEASGIIAEDQVQGKPAEQIVKSVLEIKRLEKEQALYSMELKNAELGDIFRVIAHDYNLNILVDEDVKGRVTASLTKISLEEALAEIANMRGLVMEKKGNIIRVRADLITKIFVLNHIGANTLLSAKESQLIETPGELAAEGSAGASQHSTQAASIYELLSENGKVFLGKHPNSIMIIDHPENVEKVRIYLAMVDKGMASKVFKLKYIKAKEIVGETQTPSADTSTTEVVSESTESL